MQLTNLALLAILLMILAFSVVSNTKEGYRRKLPPSQAKGGYTVASDYELDFDYPFF